ncbi:Scn8a [Symbiodinium sp. CCMP2592]|nr:Scn8a [Symbiodinium sp. CCMP2592]
MADRHGPFHALVQKLEEQHEKEVADLKATIGRLEAAVNAKHSDSGDSSKATLGPRVVRPSPITTFHIREPLPGGEQAVPKEHNASASEVTSAPGSPKPVGDIQDVASIDGQLDNEPDLLKVPLQIPPPSPGAGPPGSPGASDPVSPNSIRSMTGSFSLMSPRPSQSEEPPEEEARTLIQKIKKFVRSDTFDLVVGLLVTLNFLTMAMELQYAGLQSGYVLSIRFFDQPSASAWPWAADFFQVMRTIFLVFFTSEILLRFLFLRAAFFKTPFNVIDFVALLASLVELFSWNLPVDPTLLRLCRLAKLFRTIRVLKVSGMLDSLSLLARCMSSSGLTLVWSLLFLLVIQLIAAMIVCFMVRPYLEDVNEPEERRQEVYKYYGTFTIAVLTLFEVFFANWAPACRVLVENISEWYSLLFLIYRCGIGFAVINVVNAVFVQQTMQVAKGDEEVLLLEKQKAEEKYMKNVGRIFQTLDTSGDGLLSWAEFEVLLQDRKLKFLLDKLEIAAGDLKTLFDLLDDTGDGEISVEEFLEGITRFKGAAKSLCHSWVAFYIFMST